MDQSMDYPSIVNGVLGCYLEKEGIPNNGSFPQISVAFVENIFDAIKTIRPDWIGTNKLNKEEVDKCGGYALFGEDDSPIVLIDQPFFENSLRKNFAWIEVLIHESTHVCDFIRNKGIMGHDSFDSMLYCLPFWYWTEFHAKYKGTLFMLDWVNQFLKEYKKAYEENLFNTADSTVSFIQSNAISEMKRYNLMHLLAETAAYQESGFSIPSETIKQILPDYEEAIEFLKSKDSFVDSHFLTLLSINFNKIK